MTRVDADPQAPETAERPRAHTDSLLQEHPFPLGVLSACVAHDISSPLTYIRWDVDALAQLVSTLQQVGEDLVGTEQWSAACAAQPRVERMLREYPTMLEHIRGGLDRFQTLSRDLATLAQRDTPAASYDLTTAVASAIRLIRPHVARRLIVEIQSDDAPLLVYGSSPDMTLAVMNIGLNAAQAQTDAAGQGRLTVTLRAQDDEVVARFTDSGPGMAISPPHRAFEPFVAQDPQRCGLGLAFVHKVVTEHQGVASVESQDEGTTVTLRLPKAPQHD